jgi:hypothetical protein
MYDAKQSFGDHQDNKLLSEYHLPEDTECTLLCDWFLGDNGSKLACKMTFGWILCTSNGLRLAICSGPAYGTGTSHRAKATGMLSAAKLLYHLAQYCNMPIVDQLIYTSDNKDLIIRMRQRQQYKTCFPNVTLAPDCDLTEAIHDSTQHLKEPPKYRHVLGHHNTTTHYSHLPLTA